MAWCEAQTNVEYVLAHASNPRLSTFTWGLEQRAKAAYQQHRQQIANTLEPLIGNAKALQTELDAVVPPQVYYQSLTYQTEDSWSCPRRVVCLPHVRCQGCAASLCRHLLLHSICQRRQTPCRLLLSPRRDGKPPMRSINSICSVTAPPLKSLRVINCGCGFPQAAYVLMQALRQHALVHTKLAVARRWHHSPQTPQGCSSNSHYLSAGRHCYL